MRLGDRDGLSRFSAVGRHSESGSSQWLWEDAGDELDLETIALKNQCVFKKQSAFLDEVEKFNKQRKVGSLFRKFT